MTEQNQNQAPQSQASEKPAPSLEPSAPPTQSSESGAPTPSTSSHVLGRILQTTASLVVGILPAIPAGQVAAGAILAEEGLRAVGEFLISKGSDNALTEAEAEKQLAILTASLATIGSPLPKPETLEA